VVRGTSEGATFIDWRTRASDVSDEVADDGDDDDDDVLAAN